MPHSACAIREKAPNSERVPPPCASLRSSCLTPFIFPAQQAVAARVLAGARVLLPPVAALRPQAFGLDRLVCALDTAPARPFPFQRSERLSAPEE